MSPVSDSLNIEPKLRYKHRVDPYWGNLWLVPSQETGTTWHDRENVDLLASQGLMRPRAAELKWSYEEAMEMVTKSRRRELYQRVFGAAFMWRTLTQEQLAHIMEHNGLTPAVRDPKAIFVPWNAKLIQWGRPSDFTKLIRLVRPQRTVPAEFITGITYPEFFRTFGGQSNVAMHGRYARHNILNAEVSLRVAEHLGDQFPVVLGEGPAFSKILVPGANDKSKVFSLGDAVWVRADGLRIIVETGNNSLSILEKINRWAETLTVDAVNTSSLFLLFVVPNRRVVESWIDNVKTQIVETVLPNLRLRGFNERYIAQRIGIIEWQEWFPANHEIDHNKFDQLLVWSLDKRDKWNMTSLLDPFALSCGADQHKVERMFKFALNFHGVPRVLSKHAPSLKEEWILLAKEVSRARSQAQREAAIRELSS